MLSRWRRPRPRIFCLHPLLLLPQQQGQGACRNGAQARGRLRRRGAPTLWRLLQAFGRGAQDCQCDSVGNLQPPGYGCGYACVPRGRAHRTHHPQPQRRSTPSANWWRASRGADIQGTPLAHTPRALCVQGAQARVRQLFHCRYMCRYRERELRRREARAAYKGFHRRRYRNDFQGKNDAGQPFHIHYRGARHYCVRHIGHTPCGAKKFDWFGAYIVGLVTAIGGGTLRDLLLSIPVFWMQSPMYLAVTFLSLMTVIVFRKALVKGMRTLFFSTQSAWRFSWWWA